MEIHYFANLALLVLGLASLIEATVFDKDFLVRVEDITKINKDLTNTNKELNDTVVQQRQTMLNMTSKIRALEETVAVLEAKNTEYVAVMAAMNQTLSIMEIMQNS